MLKRPILEAKKITIAVRPKVPVALILFTLVVLGTVAYLQNMQRKKVNATTQTRPEDVAVGSTFTRSSSGATGRQSQGQWVSCREDSERKTDWCQIADQNGAVIYKGDFLPVGKVHRVPQDQLQLGVFDPANGWVSGPNESLPVPVIPLKDGTLLVPSADTLALAQRWSRDPSERDRATPAAR